MKKTLCALCAIFAAVTAADAKTLVAYYSRSGNTAKLAELIKNATDADIFEIKTSDPDHYPAEYTPMTEAAKAEIAAGNFPAINAIPALSDYDTVYIGTPIWWGTMAGPVHTFLTTADLAGKTVAPFVTHGGGGAGTSFADIETLTPNSVHVTGYAVYGGDGSADGVATWVESISK